MPGPDPLGEFPAGSPKFRNGENKGEKIFIF